MSLPLADTSDMISLHRVFRDALDNAPRYVGGVDDGDAERAELVGSYYAHVLELLHNHHEGEDELLTPRLIERAPESAELIRRIGGQHQEVLGALENADTALADWRANPTAQGRDELVGALATLNDNLIPHLDEEEREILPIASQHINVAEWGELPAHGMKNFTGDKLWLLFGLIQEQMTPEQIATMNSHMPPPLAEMWQGPGKGLYADYVAQVRR
jgi:hemerythrin-like domain-containing protein